MRIKITKLIVNVFIFSVYRNNQDNEAKKHSRYVKHWKLSMLILASLTITLLKIFFKNFDVPYFITYVTGYLLIMSETDFEHDAQTLMQGLWYLLKLIYRVKLVVKRKITTIFNREPTKRLVRIRKQWMFLLSHFDILPLSCFTCRTTYKQNVFRIILKTVLPTSFTEIQKEVAMSHIDDIRRLNPDLFKSSTSANP